MSDAPPADSERSSPASKFSVFEISLSLGLEAASVQNTLQCLGLRSYLMKLTMYMVAPPVLIMLVLALVTLRLYLKQAEVMRLLLLRGIQRWSLASRGTGLGKGTKLTGSWRRPHWPGVQKISPSPMVSAPFTISPPASPPALSPPALTPLARTPPAHTLPASPRPRAKRANGGVHEREGNRPFLVAVLLSQEYARAALHNVLLVLFVAYPVVCNMAFQAWACHTFENGESWLIADVSIVCNDATVRLRATVAVVLYPVGLMAFTAALLYRGRVAIQTNRPSSFSLAIAFLYRDYTPRCYWFELLEMSRRFLLIGVFTIVQPGSVRQVATFSPLCWLPCVSPPPLPVQQWHALPAFVCHRWCWR